MIQHVYINRICYAFESGPEGLRVFRCRVLSIKLRGSGPRCLVEELDMAGKETNYHIRYDFELYGSAEAAEKAGRERYSEKSFSRRIDQCT